MHNENTFFFGNGLKQSANHCVNLDSIYEYRLNTIDYWMHISLDNAASTPNCMLLYGKKPENAKDGEEDISIWDINNPITH